MRAQTPACKPFRRATQTPGRAALCACGDADGVAQGDHAASLGRRQEIANLPRQRPFTPCQIGVGLLQLQLPASLNVSRLPNGSATDISRPQGTVSMPGRAWR
jgi:hypothetical protein